MSVTDGQDANETTFNNAFISKTDDSTTVGKINLDNADTASGSTVTNVQREINSLDSFTGRAAGSAKDVKPTWTNNNVGVSTDDLKTRVDLLTERFDEVTGHTHDGTDSEGGPLIEAGASTAGVVSTSAQDFSGLKTFLDGLITEDTLTCNLDLSVNELFNISSFTDTISTGANVDLYSPASVQWRFVNVSLTSIRTIIAPTKINFIIITNATGATIDIRNEAGATAADRIITGTGSDLSLVNNASIILIYDLNDARWRVIGGSGSGSSSGGWTIYANENVSASGSITSSTSILLQSRRITGNAAAVTASSTPFGAGGGWTDGTNIRLQGGSSTNTVTVVHNDAAKGAILNGDCTLGQYDSLTLQYDSTADRWIEVSRSIK